MECTTDQSDPQSSKNAIDHKPGGFDVGVIRRVAPMRRRAIVSAP
jgi:hypothetical protein